jgi:hypothetical protein
MVRNALEAAYGFVSHLLDSLLDSQEVRVRSLTSSKNNSH